MNSFTESCSGHQRKKNMAENQDMNRVRDMYEGVNPGDMTEAEKKAHIGRTLQNNPDVLFRIYQQDRLHMVMFRPSDPGEWMRLIQSRITNLSFQLTRKRSANDIFKISMSGPQEHLDRFCQDFDQLYDEFMKKMQDGGAAAQNNLEDEVEELKVRIRELELEIKKLRKQ
ncbi:hypothetical protein PHYPO_G00211360 [Pangasianodon hypophthalmus]|uniref:Uncharacterized protein n=1 Tax=Pangasianodon hypophthalmus TaxID=310915 RepID=A0A5N5P4X8_PANHP|nr:hypothetical protein PHYPO_G00211360 [Pangasianodon hypophthalmus]